MYYNYSELDIINKELAEVWPDWTAVKLLGRGAFGAVYEIHRDIRGNQEKAAMKTLRVPENDTEISRLQLQGMSPQSIENYYEKLLDGMCNEIKIMQRFIGNSHIVSYEDYAIRRSKDEIRWDVFIRMELLTSLPNYMRKNPMSDQTIIKLGMDISQGLSDCHRENIIHRDIKPDNIFVNEVGKFKLGDFGVSRTAPGTHEVLSFKGSLAYMAPEVYRMVATDARSDIYSLGMVLYQCFNNNRLPFIPEKFTPDDIEKARWRQLSGEPIPPPARGSIKSQNIVLKALSQWPEERFQTAEDMYFELLDAYRSDYGSGKKPAGIAVKKEPERQEAHDGGTVLLDEGYMKNLLEESGPYPEHIPESVPLNKPYVVPVNNPEAAQKAVPYDDFQKRFQKRRGKADQYIKQNKRQSAVKKVKSTPSKADQYINMKKTQKVNPVRKIERSGPSKADRYIKEKAAARQDQIEKAGKSFPNYDDSGLSNFSSNGINPQSYDPLKYVIVLTQIEAFNGCSKSVNYRGSTLNVEFSPNSKAGIVQVSFNGEVILIETVVL